MTVVMSFFFASGGCARVLDHDLCAVVSLTHLRALVALLRRQNTVPRAQLLRSGAVGTQPGRLHPRLEGGQGVHAWPGLSFCVTDTRALHFIWFEDTNSHDSKRIEC